MELIKYFKKPGLEWQYRTQRNFLVTRTKFNFTLLLPNWSLISCFFDSKNIAKLKTCE